LDAITDGNLRSAGRCVGTSDGLRHTFGGKWALFASCLYDKFASAAWSDAGIVFDETNPGANYWDRWYLGFELGELPADEDRFEFRGLPAEGDRTGAYGRLRAEGRDLVELHALMAPRPFLARANQRIVQNGGLR